jgi:Flp pilus assembly protein TadD
MSMEQLVQQARRAAARGLFDDARRAYAKALQALPRQPELMLELGVMEAQAGDLKRARACFERALKQLPRNADVRFNLGELELAEHRPDAAEPHFRRTLELDPGHRDAAYGLGRSLMMTRRHDEAVRWLQKAAAAFASDAEVFNMLGVALNEAKRHGEAIEAFRSSLKIDPGRVSTQLSLAIALDGAGDPQRAHDIIRHLDVKASIPASLAARLAVICYGVKDFDRARRLVEQALASGHGVGRASDL